MKVILIEKTKDGKIWVLEKKFTYTDIGEYFDKGYEVVSYMTCLQERDKIKQDTGWFYRVREER